MKNIEKSINLCVIFIVCISTKQLVLSLILGTIWLVLFLT